MKPICATCEVFFKPEKNGVCFDEGFGDGTRRPYKLWLGDLWKCPNCSSLIIVGTGLAPIAQHNEDDFEDLRRHLEPEYFIDDC